MQDVEKNMDHLFREAAEKYTPKPTDSGWNDIAPQLNNFSSNAAAPAFTNKRRRNATLSLLLLLLPLSIFMLSRIFYSPNEKLNTAVKNLSSKQKIQPKNNISIATIALQKNKISSPNNKQTIAFEKNGKLTESITNLPLTSFKTGKKVVEKNTEYQAVQNATTANTFTSANEDLLLQKNELQNQKAGIIKGADTSENQLTTAKKVASLSKQKKLYLGAVFGPAFNEVKQQGFKKAGFDIGLKAEYKLTKKWSLETGLLYTKKYYFSDGKYFNMDKMPAGMQVVRLTGSSNLFEVPVTVKYNFLQKNSTDFFAAAGVSSYILTKENNNYITVLNGAQQNMKGLYKNVSAGFVSSVHLGFGYEHAFGKKNYLQIEPYVQIPLKGVGVGNMQVKSVGVHLAVTLPVH